MTFLYRADRYKADKKDNVRYKLAFIEEPDTVRKYESEGRSSFDYGIGILLSDLAVYRLVAHIQRRTDIVRYKLAFIEEEKQYG